MRKVSLWVCSACALILTLCAALAGACATSPEVVDGTNASEPSGAADASMPPPLSCPAGHSSCGNECTDLTTDMAHCGECSVDCKALGSRADACVAGKCSCRGTTGGACPVGQQCTPQGCVALACGAESCASGCCNETKNCFPAGPAHCGIAGSACVDCATFGTRVDGCHKGQCGCAANGGPPCAPGLICTTKGCSACDPTSCPSGCCSAGGCTPFKATTCGPPGTSCTDCAVIHADRADSCNPGGACGCGTGGPCATGFACAVGGCFPRCPTVDTFLLPATYEKWCDQTNASCTLLTAPTDRFLSTPAGTYTSYAVFDTSVIPAGRTIKDALFILFSAAGGTFAGSYISVPMSNPTTAQNANPPMNPAGSLGRLYAGGSIFQTAFFGLAPGASNGTAWVRAGQEHVTATTTLKNLVTGWKTGSIPNYGLSFILDVGQATSSKGKPPLTLAVCLDP